MGTSIHIQKQFEDLQRDAEHVLSTISSLSQNLGSEGKARAVAASEEAVARMRSEFETVKKKLD